MKTRKKKAGGTRSPAGGQQFGTVYVVILQFFGVPKQYGRQPWVGRLIVRVADAEEVPIPLTLYRFFVVEPVVCKRADLEKDPALEFGLPSHWCTLGEINEHLAAASEKYGIDELFNRTPAQIADVFQRINKELVRQGHEKLFKGGICDGWCLDTHPRNVKRV